MKKIKKEEMNKIDYVIVDKILDYKMENNLTKQKLANTLGVSVYLLDKLMFNPDNSRISVIQKVLSGLGLKLMVK
ncbi:MAG: hypothetical protein Q7S86_00930 [bacterium]|nr:hypothetical protein [bacterium]